jgi:hypothetical protein
MVLMTQLLVRLTVMQMLATLTRQQQQQTPATQTRLLGQQLTLMLVGRLPTQHSSKQSRLEQQQTQAQQQQSSRQWPASHLQ